jgi:hypothetical protein
MHIFKDHSIMLLSPSIPVSIVVTLDVRTLVHCLCSGLNNSKIRYAVLPIVKLVDIPIWVTIGKALYIRSLIRAAKRYDGSQDKPVRNLHSGCCHAHYWLDPKLRILLGPAVGRFDEQPTNHPRKCIMIHD